MPHSRLTPNNIDLQVGLVLLALGVCQVASLRGEKGVVEILLYVCVCVCVCVEVHSLILNNSS